MKACAPPSGGAGSGRPSGVRASSRPTVGRFGSVISVGGVAEGTAGAAAPGSTGRHGQVLGPTRTAAPRLSRTTSGTTSSACSRVRPRRRRGAGGGAKDRQGTGSTGRPAASSSTHQGTRPDGEVGTGPVTAYGSPP